MVETVKLRRERDPIQSFRSHPLFRLHLHSALERYKNRHKRFSVPTLVLSPTVDNDESVMIQEFQFLFNVLVSFGNTSVRFCVEVVAKVIQIFKRVVSQLITNDLQNDFVRLNFLQFLSLRDGRS